MEATEYKPKRYPRWITTPTGQEMIVATKEIHSSIMGIEFDENAEPVVKHPSPPSIEEVLVAGYSEAEPFPPVPDAVEDPLGMFAPEPEFVSVANDAPQKGRKVRAAKE